MKKGSKQSTYDSAHTQTLTHTYVDIFTRCRIGKRMFIALILFVELTKATTATATEPQQYLQRGKGK